MAGVSSERIGHVDWELLLPTGFVLLASSGALCAGLAGFHYIRSGEVAGEAPRVTVALVAFAVQYFLIGSVTILNTMLWPTILLFFTLAALLIAISLGFQAHSKAGFRIALAALFTLVAYACKIGSDYFQRTKFYR
jgi:hypothetical protein